MDACVGTAFITPNSPLSLAGHGSRVGEYDDIHDDLEINILAFNVPNKGVGLCITYDILFIGDYVTKMIKSYVMKTYGIPSENIILLASHTHFAPNIDINKQKLGDSDGGYISHVLNTSYQLIDKMIDDLKQRPMNLSVSYGCDTWGESINRRHPLMLIASKLGLPYFMARNPIGYRNKDIHVIALNDGDKICAVFFSLSCHPVCFPNNEISSDFIGCIRSAIRKEYGDIPVLFGQGFSGDVRPDITSQMLGLKFGKPNYNQWKKWCDGLATKSLNIIKHGLKLSSAQSVDMYLNQKPIESFFDDIYNRGGLPDYFKCHQLYLGDHVITACNAEMLGAYTRDLPDNAIPVGCLEDTFGYLPHPKNIPWGGYEVNGSQSGMGFSALFKPYPVNLREMVEQNAV